MNKTINNLTHVVTYNYEMEDWEERNMEDEGCEVEYIFDQFEDSQEKALDEEALCHRAFFERAWIVAEAAQSRFERDAASVSITEEGDVEPNLKEEIKALRKRQAWYMKEKLHQRARYLRVRCDMVTAETRQAVVNEANKGLNWCKIRLATGVAPYSVASVNALYNECVDVLADLGVFKSRFYRLAYKSNEPQRFNTVKVEVEEESKEEEGTEPEFVLGIPLEHVEIDYQASAEELMLAMEEEEQEF